MATFIGIRREDKSEWERRVPVIPEDAAQLQAQHGVQLVVQPSPNRAFASEEFTELGVAVQEDLSACPLILGIKEMPPDFFEPGKAYMFFAHVIKGQPYNMPMLQRILDLGCTLIDYERVVDEQNRRLIFFGWHAGVAGAIDTLWALGQRLDWEHVPNPFSNLRQTHRYRDLAEAKSALQLLGQTIATEGLPGQLAPLIVGIAGYGNVARGVQDMLALLPIIEIEPDQVERVATSEDVSRHHVYKVVFKEWHMAEPSVPGSAFELQDYYRNPHNYQGVFERYVPHLSVLFNAIFWSKAYPRLVTKAHLRTVLARQETPRLRVIGDISCDLEGAIEFTVKSTPPDNPVFVYNPVDDTVTDGFAGAGVVVLAVDILPAELPREASADFSRVLGPFIPAIARCDFSAPLDQCQLPPEIGRAVIAYQGQLTPDYEHLRQHLSRPAA